MNCLYIMNCLYKLIVYRLMDVFALCVVFRRALGQHFLCMEVSVGYFSLCYDVFRHFKVVRSCTVEHNFHFDALLIFHVKDELISIGIKFSFLFLVPGTFYLTGLMVQRCGVKVGILYLTV